MQEDVEKKRKIPFVLLAAVAAAQLFFWLIYNPIFIQPETGPVDSAAITAFSVASLDSPTVEALESAEFNTVQEDRLLFFETGYYATRTDFSLADIPEDGLAFWGRVPSDGSRILLNGQLLYSMGKVELPDIDYYKISYKLIHIPPAMVTKGNNRLEILMVYDIAREARVTKPLIGEYGSVSQAYNWRDLLRNEGRAIAVAVGFTLALFILVALVRAERKALLFWLFALTLLWALQNMFHIWAQIPLQGNMRGLYYSVVTLSLSASWPIFVDEWTETPKRYFQYSILAVFMLSLTAIIYWMAFSGQNTAFTNVEFILDWSGFIFIAAVMLRLIWHFWKVSDQRHWEAALLITLAMLVAIQRINFFFWGLGPPYFELSQPLFLIAFAIAYFSRNFRLFQSSAQISSLLQSELDRRTEELETANIRENQLMRQQAVDDERQRIMRDMHDGLGSNLMSMLMMAKKGRAKNEDYITGLQQVIDEMRLMIDSMDSVGESLQPALSIFRKRVLPRAKQTGFDVCWNEDIDGSLPELGPREVLQVFRILQEAITNALKHSGGDKIAVEITRNTQSNELKISVCDNGRGIAVNQRKGRGLSNMKVRAESFDAQLNIGSSDEGTRVQLAIPQ